MRGYVSTIEEGTRQTVFRPPEALCLGLRRGGGGPAHLPWRPVRVVWPLHPVALAFPHRYGFSVFLVWLAKYLTLRFWGVILYRRSLPFWYGIVVGYVVGVGAPTAG